MAITETLWLVATIGCSVCNRVLAVVRAREDESDAFHRTAAGSATDHPHQGIWCDSEQMTWDQLQQLDAS